MILQFKIPDDTYEKYVKTHGVQGALAQMRLAVEHFKDIQKDDRVIFVTGDDRRALEAVYQQTIDDGKDLVRLAKNMNTCKLGGVDMEFTQAQLERLSAQAGFHGRTPETYIRETVAELAATMLERV
jgi:hypothetical protein